jgi:hypothetical protein
MRHRQFRVLVYTGETTGPGCQAIQLPLSQPGRIRRSKDRDLAAQVAEFLDEALAGCCTPLEQLFSTPQSG